MIAVCNGGWVEVDVEMLLVGDVIVDGCRLIVVGALGWVSD